MLSRLFPKAADEVADQDAQVELIRKIGVARYAGRVYSGLAPEGKTKNPYDAVGRYIALCDRNDGFLTRLVRASFAL